jgi:hypothetical protein
MMHLQVYTQGWVQPPERFLGRMIHLCDAAPGCQIDAEGHQRVRIPLLGREVSVCLRTIGGDALTGLQRQPVVMLRCRIP